MRGRERLRDSLSTERFSAGRIVMRIGETIATYDVGLALRGKSGRFEITGPTGEIYDVTCKPSHSVANLEWSSNGNDHPPFLIRRIAEGDLLADTKAMTAGLPEAELPEEESLSACSPIPFMLEPAAEEERMPNVGNIELLYLEDNRETGQMAKASPARTRSRPAASACARKSKASARQNSPSTPSLSVSRTGRAAATSTARSSRNR